MRFVRIGNALTPVGFTFYLVAMAVVLLPGSFEALPSSVTFEPSLAFEIPLFGGAAISFLAWALNAWYRPVAKSLVFSTSIAIGTATGFVLLYIVLHVDSIPIGIAFVSGAINGLALSSGAMVWVRIFATRDFYFSSTRIVVSAGIASMLSWLITLLPHQWFWVVLMSMTVVSCFAMPVCIKAHDFSHSSFNHKPSEYRNRYIKQVRNLWRPVLFALTTSFVWGVMRAFNKDAGYADLTGACTSAGMLLSAATLAVLWTLFNDKFGFIRVFKVLVPIMMVLFVCFALLGGVWTIALSVFLSYAYVLAWLLMFLICARDAQNKNVHPFVVWGAFSALFSIAADFAGYLVAFPFVWIVAQYADTSLSAVVGLLCMLVLSAAIYIDDQVKPEKVSAAEKEAKESLTRSIEQRCNAISDERGLSPREREVFCMLARGRDVYHISEELFVAVSTVQFHCKNIYKKLDVHSKQDLITLVESYKGSGGGFL